MCLRNFQIDIYIYIYIYHWKLVPGNVVGKGGLNLVPKYAIWGGMVWGHSRYTVRTLLCENRGHVEKFGKC